MKLVRFVCLFLCVAAPALAQNGIPFLNQPLVPSAVPPGSAAFTLTVHGASFTPASTVNWNGTPLVTTYVNRNQLTASVPAADLTTTSTSSVTVSNPGSGGGTSNVVPFTITNPMSSLNFQAVASPTPNATSVATGDINGDGRPDLVATIALTGTGECSEAGGGAISSFLGNGDGTFTPKWTFDLGCLPTLGTRGFAITLGDFNNDGKLDLLVSYFDHGYYIALFFGNGDGTFVAPHGSLGGYDQMGTITLGDFNRDGNLDFTVGFNIGNLYEQGTYLGLGNGDFAFSPYDFVTVYSQVTGDFNGDGILDLATSPGKTFNGPPTPILLGNGDGTFTPASTQPTNPEAVFVGDFNGDGILDLGSLLGNGDGTFRDAPTRSQPADLAQGPNEVVADINGDNRLDQVAGAVALGIGDGTFQPSFVLPLSANPVSIAVTDFDGDGRLDVVSANDDGTLTILLNTSPRIASTTTTLTSSINPSSFNQSVTFTATVTPPGGGTATGTVSFFDGSKNLGTRTLIGGVATLTLSTLAIGAHSITAVYGGDANFATSTSAVLSQTVQGVIAYLSQIKLNFGNQTVRIASSPQSVTLTNRGNIDLLISSIGISGANAGDFSQSNTCGASLAPSASCTIAVTFTPTAAGARAAFVAITDNGPKSPQTITLTGAGVSPTATVSPANLTFSTQVVFTSSMAQTVTITNSGLGTLVMTSVATTGPFSDTNGCGSTLSPGASCSISVTFTPTTKRPISGSLTIADNAPGSPQKVPLKGTGTFVQLAPTILSFGNQPVGTKSLPKKVTVSNKGDAAVSIASIAITGANATDFSKTSTCGRTLASGSSCFVTVAFTPSATGARTASIAISDNGGGTPQTVGLNGTGTP